MTSEEMYNLLERASEVKKQMQKAVVDCLKQIGHPVNFDWEYSSAPSYASAEFNTSDFADAYISKIWLDGEDHIKVNLHAYYLGDDKEDVLLARQTYMDWQDLLSNLVPILDNPEDEYIPEEDEEV